MGCEWAADEVSKAFVDPEKRAELLSKAKDALLAFFVSYLPQAECEGINGDVNGVSQPVE